MQRRLLYFVPAIATLVAGYALVGPGRSRAVVGCRVLAAKDDEGKLRSFRLQVVERLGGLEEPRALEGLDVFVDGVQAFHGAAGADGTVEVRVRDPKAGPHRLSVAHGKTVLATGEVETTRAAAPSRRR